MSGYMLRTGEGRLTYGTFVVSSHRCRVEWAKVVSEKNKIINAKMSDYAYTRIHTHSLQERFGSFSMTPHLPISSLVRILTSSPFLPPPHPPIPTSPFHLFSIPSIASSSHLMLSSSHVCFFFSVYFIRSSIKPLASVGR